MFSQTASLACLAEQLAGQGMALCVTRKRIKNINFRVCAGKLLVSAPLSISDRKLAISISARVDWAISAQAKLRLTQHQLDKPLLWGEPLDMTAWAVQRLGMADQANFARLDDENKFIYIAKTEIAEVLPRLLSHWQDVVGRQTSHITIRHMVSRWGSCNTRTARISLSTKLAKYPIDCLGYVLVHELCHLHHANHSAAFWRCVAEAMPDYKKWHNLLKGKGEL